MISNNESYRATYITLLLKSIWRVVYPSWVSLSIYRIGSRFYVSMVAASQSISAVFGFTPQNCSRECSCQRLLSYFSWNFNPIQVLFSYLLSVSSSIEATETERLNNCSACHFHSCPFSVTSQATKPIPLTIYTGNHFSHSRTL